MVKNKTKQNFSFIVQLEFPLAHNMYSYRFPYAYTITDYFPGLFCLLSSIFSDGKASAFSALDPGSIPGLRRPPGEGNATHSSTFAWKIP